MEKKLFQARIRLEFLLDNATLSPAQIRSNNQTFSWNDRLPNVFEEHRAIIADKTTQFQDALKVGTTIVLFKNHSYDYFNL